MSHCKHIVQQLSEYRDGSLSVRDHQEVAEHLADCTACAEQDRDLRRTIALLGAIPMPEPRLDLWQEFAVKMTQIEAEQRLAPMERVANWGRHLMASVAEGMVLYTHAVAHRTLVSMERFLIRDPFRAVE